MSVLVIRIGAVLPDDKPTHRPRAARVTCRTAISCSMIDKCLSAPPEHEVRHLPRRLRELPALARHRSRQDRCSAGSRWIRPTCSTRRRSARATMWKALDDVLVVLERPAVGEDSAALELQHARAGRTSGRRTAASCRPWCCPSRIGEEARVLPRCGSHPPLTSTRRTTSAASFSRCVWMVSSFSPPRWIRLEDCPRTPVSTAGPKRHRRHRDEKAMWLLRLRSRGVVIGPPQRRHPALAPGDEPALPGSECRCSGARKNSLSLNQISPLSSLATIQPAWPVGPQVERRRRDDDPARRQLRGRPRQFERRALDIDDARHTPASTADRWTR